MQTITHHNLNVSNLRIKMKTNRISTGYLPPFERLELHQPHHRPSGYDTSCHHSCIPPARKMEVFEILLRWQWRLALKYLEHHNFCFTLPIWFLLTVTCQHNKRVAYFSFYAERKVPIQTLPKTNVKVFRDYFSSLTLRSRENFPSSTNCSRSHTIYILKMKI